MVVISRSVFENCDRRSHIHNSSDARMSLAHVKAGYSVRGSSARQYTDTLTCQSKEFLLNEVSVESRLKAV